jgi:uncharacterized protein (TIGR03663 family)
MNNKAFKGLFVLIVFGALVFRLAQLNLRPLHHDEANQAVKFGVLLEKGEYSYDRNDHHGPSLYYLSLPFTWIFSGKDFASLHEKTLRLVPAIFGAGLILFFLLLKGGMNRWAIILSGLFMAVSPVMVFFSRFYIQEILLLFFIAGTIGAGWRYSQNPSTGWALAAGLSAGMMYTTKETCIIVFGALVSALVLTKLFRRRGEFQKDSSNSPKVKHLFISMGAALLISGLFYSSFFRNPGGPLDSLLAFGSYFSRAGEAGMHVHPWYYYIKMLAYSRYGPGPVWSEALILILAAGGCFSAFKARRENGSGYVFIRFVFFYTLLSTIIFSLIAYKTPWNILPFYMGMILLAGEGVVFLIRKTHKIWTRGVVLLLLGLGIFNLGAQSYRANFKYFADPRNPYVYAHTSTDFLNLVQRIEDIALLHPDHKQMLIKVITGPYETWPLPWYLRKFTRVGYWQEVGAAGEIPGVPVIISSIDKLDKLQVLLGDDYQSEFYGLRPEVLLAVHIRQDLWNKFLQKQAER